MFVQIDVSDHQLLEGRSPTLSIHVFLSVQVGLKGNPKNISGNVNECINEVILRLL